MAYVIAVVVLIVSVIAVHHARAKQREAYIDALQFHPAVHNKFCEVRPTLTQEHDQQVCAALRDYFHHCRMAGQLLWLRFQW